MRERGQGGKGAGVSEAWMDSGWNLGSGLGSKVRPSDRMIVDTGGSDGTDTDKSDVYMLVYY